MYYVLIPWKHKHRMGMPHEEHDKHQEHEHKHYDAEGHQVVPVYIPDCYMETIYSVVDVMKHHPDTWEKYLGTENEWADIINMEIGELQTRMKDTKASHADIARECKHVAAACLCNYKRIQKMYK